MSFLSAKNFQKLNGDFTSQIRQVCTQRTHRTVTKKIGKDVVKRQHELFLS